MKDWGTRDQGFLIECNTLIVAPKIFKLDAEVPNLVCWMINEYVHIFKPLERLPPNCDINHRIQLIEDTAPMNVQLYCYAWIQKGEIERLVEELLTAGIIRPSISPYFSLLLLVKKKDGGWHFCVDYRALNNVTIPNKFLIPMIEELLEELHGSSVYSKLDLKSGYHQIQVDKADIQKTTFQTHKGHYEFLVMPFGLLNAPFTFQALMNQIFRPFLRKFILVFFDDILI